MRKRKLVYGVGINDADYTKQIVNGKQVMCPFYSRWTGMLKRGHSERYKNLSPTYKDVTVCVEWNTFSVFKTWMEKQPWEGMQLDKDFLLQGNKVYSEATCVFIPAWLNSLILNSMTYRGEFPLGVRLRSDMVNSNGRKFTAQMGLKGTQTGLGHFHTPEEAHVVWQAAKKDNIKEAITQYTEEWEAKGFVPDQRVIVALHERINQLQYDIDNGLITEKL